MSKKHKKQKRKDRTHKIINKTFNIRNSGDSSPSPVEYLISPDRIETEALAQIRRNASRDFVKKLVILPDVHTGYDLPIGSVALTDGIISPSFVGYDIGCGMCLTNTRLPADDVIFQAGGKERIFTEIQKRIPMGLGREHQLKKDYPVFRSAIGDKELDRMINEKASYQLGTLGSGNHFIEIGKNQEGHIAITIHSGSRNVGHTLCSYYMKKFGLYLPLDTDPGQAYLADLNEALRFALENRLDMMREILRILSFNDIEINKIIQETLINENHNHAIVTPDGVLHRKGATQADEGQMGVIPANMRDGVFVTRGLGNRQYLSSASHGAGRVMSRSQAKKVLSIDSFKKSMQGIIARTDPAVLDEAPSAYKDISEVIALQQGIVVDITDRVKPIINMKG